MSYNEDTNQFGDVDKIYSLKDYPRENNQIPILLEDEDGNQRIIYIYAYGDDDGFTVKTYGTDIQDAKTCEFYDESCKIVD